MSTTVAQLYRQAESLKTNIADSSFGSNEAWVSRQKLQDLYQRLLVVDLEYSLDKKVEQDLWNHVFKNQINAMQSQAKDRQNAKKGEVQASLNLFLETASGFYLQLLQELCSAFKLDLPFRRRSSYFGILREANTVKGMKTPKKSSSLYICQYCLVHLGDIARYRQQIEQAQTYYRHAAFLVPYNGQPYNQLAILEAAKGNKLSTVFYYVRSLAVKHPFPVAATNLEKFYSKVTKEVLDIRGKLTMSEIIGAFLQFHSLIHMCTDLDRAQKLMNQLLSSLPSHITSMSFNSHQFVEIIVINLYAMYHAKKHLSKRDKPSQDEQRAYTLVLQLTVSVLDHLLHSTPKNNKAREYHTLPAIKLILDWLRVNQDILSTPLLTNSTIWPCACKLFNHIQHWSQQRSGKFKMSDYEQTPLPEDAEVQCFIPLENCYKKLDFSRQLIDNLPAETETQIRCHRLVDHGIWVCDEFPSLNLLNYLKQRSGYHQFTAPTAHVKLLPGDGDDSSGVVEKKSTRQNVAIQAILQHRAGQSPKQDMDSKKELNKSKPGIGDQIIPNSKQQDWTKHVQILPSPHKLTQPPQTPPKAQQMMESPKISPQLNMMSSPVGAMATGLGDTNHVDYTQIRMNPQGQPKVNKMAATMMQPQQRVVTPKDVKVMNDVSPGGNFPNQNQTTHFNIFNQGFGPLLQDGVSGQHSQHNQGYYNESSPSQVDKRQYQVEAEKPSGWSQLPWNQNNPSNQQRPQYIGQKVIYPSNQHPFPSNQNQYPRQQPQPNQIQYRPAQPQVSGQPPYLGNSLPMQQRYPNNQMPYPRNQVAKGNPGNLAMPRYDHNLIGSRSMVSDHRQEPHGPPPNDMDRPAFSMAPGTVISHEDMERNMIHHGRTFKMAPPDGMQGYPPSAAEFSRLAEGVPKPDSPLDALPRPMFPTEKAPINVAGGATYSLFSQSPWTVTGSKGQDSKGYGMMQGYSTSPDGHGEHGASGPYIGSNIQSLWSSGPSPLEKLLEQQKQQRQSEPPH